MHRSQVVRPSAATLSSRKGGLGGGGTKRPFHRPFSLLSNASGDSKVSSSMAFNQKSSSSLLAGKKLLLMLLLLLLALSAIASLLLFKLAVAMKSAVTVGSYGDSNCALPLYAGVAVG